MVLNKTNLAAGLKRIAARMETEADTLNTADGRLGDGDLGITMVRGSRLVLEILDDLPDDLGMAFMKVSQAFTKTSGSSYGTLLATGLLTAAKATKGREDMPWAETSTILGQAIEAMMARGKASLGDKTVLDTLEAVRRATDGLDDPAELLKSSRAAAASALDTFRDQANKIGRARMFGDKSIGLDDPGMLAFQAILDGLT
ncbi:MAG: dihydroxyacetone kinase subunit L [Alphaproteobacteria bacterium]